MTRNPVKLDLHVRKVADRSTDLLKGLAALTQNEVLVGIPAEKTERQSDEPTNAQLAYIHDLGSPTQNIPPRPFMAPGIQDAKDPITTGLRNAGDAALDGKTDAILTHLNAVGLVASTAIKLRINNGPFVPLKPATIAARQRQGFAGTKPLIRTAQMRNAVTYVIRKAS